MEVIICFVSVDVASSYAEHTVFEYERHSLVFGWGHVHLEHFLPGERRWSTATGKRFADELTDLAAPVPEGWAVLKKWYTVGKLFFICSS